MIKYRHQIRIGRLISNSYSLPIMQINKNQSHLFIFWQYNNRPLVCNKINIFGIKNSLAN